MSFSATDSVLAQLVFLGVDACALQAQSAHIEIDRFDHWANPDGITMTEWPTTAWPTTVDITPALQAA